MANTETSPTESTPADAAAPATNNTPANTTVVNKPNPNMVMFVVLLFMLFIGLAVALILSKNDSGDGGSELSEKEQLQKLIAAERGAGSLDSETSAAVLDGRLATIMENTQAIKSEYEVMKSGYTNAQEKLKQSGAEVQGYMNTISRLGSENTALKNQNAQLQSLAQNAQNLQNQVQQLGSSILEKDSLIAILQGRPSVESMQSLKQSLDQEQLTKSDLGRKLQELERKMLSMVDAGEVNINKVKVMELQAQNDELRKQLQVLQTNLDFSKLFVKSQDSLPAFAQALYAELKGLEGANAEQLRSTYIKIGNELNAENLQQVRFATGSSVLSFTDQTKIKSKIDTTNATDYFLVVGYASQTGDANSNEKLSAKRATAVASVVNQLKAAGQDVRAVYLGQTNRFSQSVNAENQLCEIWRIKK